MKAQLAIIHGPDGDIPRALREVLEAEGFEVEPWSDAPRDPEFRLSALIFCPERPLTENAQPSIEDFRRRLEDDCGAAFRITRDFSDRFVDDGSGRVLFIVHGASFQGEAADAAASASHAADVGLGRALNHDLERYGVTATTILCDQAAPSAVADMAKLVLSPSGADLGGRTLTMN